MVYITGVGIVSNAGTSPMAVWENLNDIEFTPGYEQLVSFKVDIPATKLRRISRYSKLALSASLHAKNDSEENSGEAYNISENPYRYGTIFSTGYGAIESNIEFSASVTKNEPDLVSPTLFSSTVPNACVGQVCMHLGTKGVSTILIGGNPILYSKLLIDTGKADVIFMGFIEEYSADLFASLKQNEFAKTINLNEASIVYSISKNPKNAYAEIGKSTSISFPAYPLVKKVDREYAKEQIKTVLEKQKNSDITAIFTSANGSYFDEIENTAVKEVFPDVLTVTNIKQIFGETLGSSLGVNIAVAVLSLKNAYIPMLKLGNPQNILVTGYDTIGNYHTVLLKKVE